MLEEKKQNPIYGKPWSTHSLHGSYNAANDARISLTKDESLQVKIRRNADNTFSVKTRELMLKSKGASVPGDTKIAKAGKIRPKTRAGRRAEKMKRKAAQTNNP